MRYFGTVESFDAKTGRGLIRPGGIGGDIRFQKGAALWHRSVDPVSGQLFSYEVALTERGARAVKLRPLASATAGAGLEQTVERNQDERIS